MSGLATTISDNAGVLHPDAFTTYGPSGWDINAATGVAMSGFAVDLEPWGGAAPPTFWRFYHFVTVRLRIGVPSGTAITSAVLRLTDSQTAYHGTLPANTIHCWVSERSFTSADTPVYTGIIDPFTAYGNDPTLWDPLNGPWRSRHTSTVAPSFSIDITADVQAVLTTPNADPYMIFMLALDHPTALEWPDPTPPVLGPDFLTYLIPTVFGGGTIPPPPIANYLEITL